GAADLRSLMDAVCGTRVVRIADDSGRPIAWTDPKVQGGSWSEISRHHYSDDEPWRSDGAVFALQNVAGRPPDIYLDATTYRPKFGRPSNYQVGDDRWHPSKQHPH